MISFQRILFPVDFSSQNQEAAPFVKIMAERFHSDLTLLHVARFFPLGYGTPDAIVLHPMLDLEELVEQRTERLDQFLSQELAGACVERTVVVGDPDQEIAKYARDQAIDLIMMPTHGYGPFRRFLLGSVTAKVLHDTDCPVWTGVHTDELWSRAHQKWGRLLCAVDADPRDAALLRWAAQFASEQGLELDVVHALPAAAPTAYGAEPPELRGFLLDIAEQRLSDLQSEAGTDFDIQLRFGKVEDVVRCVATRRQADLILIGRGVLQKPLGRLRSAAYAIIRNAPCPVISI